jgi:hypothetical protein
MPEIINRTEERVHIDNIQPHPANPNDGDVQAIAESIRQNGFYGRIVVRDSTGKILAGEHRWRAAQEVGLSEVPIERVECDDETAMRILLADNRTAEKAEREPEPLADLLESLETTDDGLTGTGYDGGDLDELLDDLGRDSPQNGSAEKYNQEIDTPTYEPTGRQPSVNDLYDAEKAMRLVQAIEEADLPDGLQRFLRLAAMRHVEIDFEAVAEFYAHADAETQRHFEDSALVIIDFDDAIEEGFVQLSERMASIIESQGHNG